MEDLFQDYLRDYYNEPELELITIGKRPLDKNPNKRVWFIVPGETMRDTDISVWRLLAWVYKQQKIK